MITKSSCSTFFSDLTGHGGSLDSWISPLTDLNIFSDSIDFHALPYDVIRANPCCSVFPAILWLTSRPCVWNTSTFCEGSTVPVFSLDLSWPKNMSMGKEQDQKQGNMSNYLVVLFRIFHWGNLLQLSVFLCKVLMCLEYHPQVGLQVVLFLPEKQFSPNICKRRS